MPAQSFRSPNLRLRILAPAALVAIPAIALLFYVSADRRQQAERAVAQDAQRLAALEALHHEALIEGTRQLLIAISQSRDLREGHSEACSGYLRGIVPQLAATYVDIGVLDRRGTLVCSGFTGTLVSLADRSYFRRAIASRSFVVGEYIAGGPSDEPVLPFAYPLLDDRGNVRLVVFATVGLQPLNAAPAGDDWPEDARAIVTDRQQTIVAMHPASRAGLVRSPPGSALQYAGRIGESLQGHPVMTRFERDESAVFEHAGGGGTDVYAFQRIRPLESGMTVTVSRSKAQAIAAANASMYRTLAAFGIVALVVIAGVKMASDRLLLRPIAELIQASRRLATGDLGERVASSTSIPELLELGQGFDLMAATLEDRESARLRVEMEREELQRQYYESQKMDAVGRLAGGIAHDFNNMLTAILGYCELLLDDPDLGESQRADVREIEKAGNTAARLTRQLLAFSRREIVEPAVLDLNAIVSGMDKMLHRLLGEHIDMVVELADGLDPVRADRGHIEQVILNLAVNGRDAMPEGGRLAIATANVHLPDGLASPYLAAPPGHYVMASVSDTGSGMASEVLGHLFEPFYTTKDTGKGTGLGLATIYGIVKQGNGGIVVESEVGRGSTFEIYFPRSSQQTAVPEAGLPESAQPSGKATILVVEDDRGIRELAAKVLGRCGYDVLSAGGGEEAHEICQRHDGAIHVLLSDVVMPGMNGPAVAEMLTRQRPSMKVLFMSGYTDDPIVRHGVMERDLPFLQKSFTPERLANKILEVLG